MEALRLSGLGVSLALWLGVAACGLNPQPLPPGEVSDGAVNDNPGAGGGATNATGGPADASTPSAPGEGGQGLDAGDGSTDAGGPADGSSDAPPSDAGDAGDASD